MEIKAIIFDFDMTLVDTSHAIAYAMNRFAEIMGLRKVSYDEVLATIGLPMEKSLSVLWQGAKPEWLDIYSSECRPLEYEKMRPFPGVPETLKALKDRGLKLAITSNRRSVKKAIDHLGLGEYFDLVLGLEEVNIPKPEPYILLEAIESLGVGRDQVAYVGDTVIDMITAKNAGIVGIGVTTGPSSEEELVEAGAFLVLSSVNDVLKIFLDSTILQANVMKPRGKNASQEE